MKKALWIKKIEKEINVLNIFIKGSNPSHYLVKEKIFFRKVLGRELDKLKGRI